MCVDFVDVFGGYRILLVYVFVALFPLRHLDISGSVARLPQGSELRNFYLVDVLDIFFFNSCSGEGKGESGATGKGGGCIRVKWVPFVKLAFSLAWKPCAFWVQNGSIFGLFALRFQ